MRVVQVSTIWDSTPEGQFRMDRVQMMHDALLRSLTPAERETLQRLDEACDRMFLEGS